MTQIAATSNAAASTETRHTQAAGATGTSFASVHAAAVSDATDKDKAKPDGKSTSASEGERTEKVDGHRYTEVISGPRNGMFINNSGNTRDGRAFVIVKREGREFHIYGTGDDRAVYEVGRERAASGTSQGSGTTGAGTTGASSTGQPGSSVTGTAGTPTT